MWNGKQIFTLTAEGIWGDCVGKRPLEIHLLLDNLLVFILADWNIFGMPLCLLSVFPQLYFHMIRQRKKVLGHAEDYSKVEWPDHTEMSHGGKKNLKQPKEEEHKHKRSSGPELAWLETAFFSPSFCPGDGWYFHFQFIKCAHWVIVQSGS